MIEIFLCQPANFFGIALELEHFNVAAEFHFRRVAAPEHVSGIDFLVQTPNGILAWHCKKRKKRQVRLIHKASQLFNCLCRFRLPPEFFQLQKKSRQSIINVLWLGFLCCVNSRVSAFSEAWLFKLCLMRCQDGERFSSA